MPTLPQAALLLGTLVRALPLPGAPAEAAAAPADDEPGHPGERAAELLSVDQVTARSWVLALKLTRPRSSGAPFPYRLSFFHAQVRAAGDTLVGLLLGLKHNGAVEKVGLAWQ